MMIGEVHPKGKIRKFLDNMMTDDWTKRKESNDLEQYLLDDINEEIKPITTTELAFVENIEIKNANIQKIFRIDDHFKKIGKDESYNYLKKERAVFKEIQQLSTPEYMSSDYIEYLERLGKYYFNLFFQFF